MTASAGSLRLRLLVLILVPLILVSCFAVYWRFENARQTAEDIFDRNLVMLCLAVSRDVAYSGGDTLSETTSNLIRAASGGEIFYHVYGPDGSFVTGYSSPPVQSNAQALENNVPVLFDALHLGRPVRAASLGEQVTVDGIAGASVVTVWQELQPRQNFAGRLAVQAAILAAVLVLTVAAVVIFGIRLGLRPLDQLEKAIQKRSTSDLSPIERPVPAETRGIVQRLNNLFEKLTDARIARERLISNAAHQLRNPVAAIHAMAQAIHTSKSLKDSRERASELVGETRRTMRLTKQMLSLERIKGIDLVLQHGDVSAFLKDLSLRIGPAVLEANLAFELEIPGGPIFARFDARLLEEAVKNLVDNALAHAGENLTTVQCGIRRKDARQLEIYVKNDGDPLEVENHEHFFERFSQGRESEGFGLGLAIVQQIAALHHGAIETEFGAATSFSIVLNIAESSD